MCHTQTQNTQFPHTGTYIYVNLSCGLEIWSPHPEVISKYVCQSDNTNRKLVLILTHNTKHKYDKFSIEFFENCKGRFHRLGRNVPQKILFLTVAVLQFLLHGLNRRICERPNTWRLMIICYMLISLYGLHIEQTRPSSGTCNSDLIGAQIWSDWFNFYDSIPRFSLNRQTFFERQYRFVFVMGINWR